MFKTSRFKGLNYWLWLLLLAIGTAFANEVYRWTDERGQVVFSDQPNHADAESFSVTPVSGRYLYQVKRVHDGDTLTLANEERVRFLSINAPEVSSRSQAAEPGGEAARNWLRAQLGSGPVMLEYDVEPRDRYDRILAYLWTPDGDFLNEQLLQQGLASLTLMPPNLKYADRLIAAQQQAIDQRLGIWSETDYPLRNALNVKDSNYRGWHRWQMTPSMLRDTRNFYFLQVNQHLSLRIAKADLAEFPPLESYLNQSLEVRGWLSKQGSSYSIRVYHPSAIVIR